MLEVERDFVEPLFRPPLSLSVVAAAFKYVATVVVLTDPLLSTSSEYVQKRQADDNTAQKIDVCSLPADLHLCSLLAAL